MTTRCPSGHDSTESDYCSVCGVSVASASPRASGVQPVGGGGASETCPSCSEPRTDHDARFCEVCRYDFHSGKPGPAPRAQAAAVPIAVSAGPPVIRAAAPSPQAPPAPGASPVATTAFVLVVQVDPTLDDDPDPAQPCPNGTAEVLVAVDRPELLVGRRDDTRDIHPEIPVTDPGTSRRHAKFVRALDGTLAFLDLASTNGSKLNGVEVAAGSRSPLHVGDEITIGRWTRIRVTVGP